nr:hypothetical protein [Allomuricauda sp.]
MKRDLHLYMVLLMLCLVSCKAQKETQEPSADEQSKIVLVDQDEYSGFAEYNTMVIRDFKSLAKFYAEVNKTRKPGLPIPKIDFSQEMVLVICAGEQKGPQSAELSVLEENNADLVVGVSMKPNQDPNTLTSTVISHPFYLYKIPSVDKEVVFQKR